MYVPCLTGICDTAVRDMSVAHRMYAASSRSFINPESCSSIDVSRMLNISELPIIAYHRLQGRGGVVAEPD